MNKDAEAVANNAVREFFISRGVDPDMPIERLLDPKDGDLIKVKTVDEFGRAKTVIAVRGGARING